MVDQAIFSKEGPNLNNPADTNIPRVIPKIYKLKKRKNKCRPRSNIDIPKSGEVNNIAGTSPIKALIKAVKTITSENPLFSKKRLQAACLRYGVKYVISHIDL